MLNNMLVEWTIEVEKINCVVRDGDSALGCGIRQLDVDAAHCFLHIIHLICTDNMDAQQGVVNLCAKVSSQLRLLVIKKQVAVLRVFQSSYCSKN